jgi:hypothetical protein
LGSAHTGPERGVDGGRIPANHHRQRSRHRQRVSTADRGIDHVDVNAGEISLDLASRGRDDTAADDERVARVQAFRASCTTARSCLSSRTQMHTTSLASAS